MKTILVPLISAAICLTILSRWTDGFKAFTVYSYTLQKAGNMPREFPDMELENQNGKKFHINEEGKFVLVNFVYLDCPSVCHKINNRLEDIYHLMPSGFLPEKVEFITISFDPQRDDVERIRKYRNLFASEDISGWNFAIPCRSDRFALNGYLKSAGIWAYPSPVTGMINHSVYLFLISPDNKVIATFDPARESNEYIAQKVQSFVRQDKFTNAVAGR